MRMMYGKHNEHLLKVHEATEGDLRVIGEWMPRPVTTVTSSERDNPHRVVVNIYHQSRLVGHFDADNVSAAVARLRDGTTGCKEWDKEKATKRSDLATKWSVGRFQE